MVINPIINEINTIKDNDEIINNVFLVSNDDKSYEYVGYIDIPKYNIKRLIKIGETKEILDSKYVLYYNSFHSLDKNNSNIILLGHNIESVFRVLHYLDIGDDIILVTHNTCYNFVVTDIDIVNETEVGILNKLYGEKTLTLITCMDNNKNRLILTAKIKKII